MEVQEIIEKMKELQQKIIDYLDDECEEEEDPFGELINYLDEIEIKEVRNGFIEFIQFLVILSNNHHRTSNFFTKIQQILLHFKDTIKQTLSNSRIFKLFSICKPLLLFLIKEGFLIPDQSIVNQLNNEYFKVAKYYLYFYPEFNEFYDTKTKDELKNEYDELTSDGIENFNKNREIGENEKTICSMIRDDLADEFITYINQNNLSNNITLDPTVFESNSFLISRSPSLIEYSAFYGAIQIFKYFDMNKVKLTDSLWLYSIHGKNGELIHYLEDNKVIPKDWSYFECFKESIKCRHDNIANYIHDNLMFDDAKKNDEKIDFCLKYMNYSYLPEDLTNGSIFYDLCKYNYSQIVFVLLKTSRININYVVKRVFKIRLIFI